MKQGMAPAESYSNISSHFYNEYRMVNHSILRFPISENFVLGIGKIRFQRLENSSNTTFSNAVSNVCNVF